MNHRIEPSTTGSVTREQTLAKLGVTAALLYVRDAEGRTYLPLSAETLARACFAPFA